MLLSLGLIAIGFVFLVWGADRFIAGAAATARNLGVSPLIIGLTVIGFGTSAPEMVVSGVAALRGNPGLAVGNAIGSNIANIALILGVTACIYPLQVHSNTLKREYPILLVVTLTALFLMVDGALGRFDGGFLLFGLLAMTTWMALIGMQRGGPDPIAAEFASEIPSDMSTPVAMGWLGLGMIVLPASSHILVLGAVDVANRMGVSDAVIGLTIVAIGTSLPELAAGIASVLKREHELVIGNIIGSNMFNLMGVLGIAATIRPTDVPDELIYRDYFIMLFLSMMMFLMAYGFRGPGRISRRSGIILVTMFVAYQSLVFYTEVSRSA
ncbi:MAG: calcium/sodium antiporter [Xanthomonadales bacterium]|nr:calcium/sodium antiporter [Xanthomonadales bacterium]